MDSNFVYHTVKAHTLYMVEFQEICLQIGSTVQFYKGVKQKRRRCEPSGEWWMDKILIYRFKLTAWGRTLFGSASWL